MPFAAAYRTPDFIARATTQTLRLTVRDGAGAAATVTSGTLTIKTGGGTEIVTAAAITPSAGVATYSLAAALVPVTLPYARDWTEVWTLTLSTGEVLVFTRAAHLVRAALAPVIDAADLLRRHPTLTTQYRSSAGSLAPLQVFVDEAWDTIQGRMIGDGRYPQTVIDAWALAEPHIALALSYVFRALSTYTTGSGAYVEHAEQYATAFERQWGKVNWQADNDEDGVPDGDASAAEPVVLMFDPPRRWGRG